MSRMQQVAENAAVYGIWTGIVLILLTPFVVTPDTIFPFVVGKAVYSRSLIECVFGVWAILALFRPAYRPPRSRLLLLLALSVGASILAACFGVSPQRSFWSTYERMQGVVDHIHWFAFAVVLASMLRTERDWRVVLNINIGASLVMAVLAICLYYLGDALFAGYRPDYRFTATSAQFGVDSARRAHATLGNPLYLSGYLLVNCVVALGFLIRSYMPPASAPIDPSSQGAGAQKKSFSESNGSHNRLELRMGRCFWGGSLSLIFWGVLFSGSRSGVLALVTSMMFFWLAFYSRYRVFRFIVAGFIGITILAAVSIALESSMNRPSSPVLRALLTAEEDNQRESVRLRLEMWKSGLRGFIERPSLGWGPENYVVIFGRYASEYGHKAGDHDNAHNKIIEELSTRGVLGLMVHLILWIQIFLVIRSAIVSSNVRNSVLPICIGAALVGYFVRDQFSITSSSTFLQYILFFGFVTHLETRGGMPLTVGRGGYSFRCNKIRTFMIVGVLVVVGAGLHTHQAIYSAAVHLKIATDQRNLAGQSAFHIRQAITRFPSLANSSRILFFDSMPALWKNLYIRHKVEAARLLKFMETEAAVSVVHEPKNWQIYRNLARVYALVSEFDPKYKDKARRHSDQARELAPRCIIWSSPVQGR